MAAHLLENDRLAITVDDHGAELIRIYDKQQDRDVLWEADPRFWARHAPILFPNVGKYHQKHGVCSLTDNMFETDARIFDNQFDWAAKGGAPFVCLEPWMGRTDNYGFTGDISTKPGINALQAGDVFTASYTITIH